jgi:hypothetical protein
MVAGGRIHVAHGGQEVAVHPECAGRRQRLLEPAHFSGISSISLLRSAPPRAAGSGVA